MNRREVGFALGLLAGLALLAPLGWLLTAFVAVLVVAFGALEEVARQRAREAAVCDVLLYRRLLQERAQAGVDLAAFWAAWLLHGSGAGRSARESRLLR